MHKIRRLIAPLILSLVFFTVSTSLAHASTYTVNSTGDEWDAKVGDNMCRTATNTCTLRAALNEANNHTGADTIAFNIPGTGPFTIQIPVGKSLPQPTAGTKGPITIDGYTQPGAAVNTSTNGSNAVIKIHLRGNGYNDIDAFTIKSSNNTVRGLAFSNFRAVFHILTAAASGNKLYGNFIGIDPSGVSPYWSATGGRIGGANSMGSGIHIEQGAPNNIIGDVSLQNRNIISGNNYQGIRIDHGGSNNNVIQNNIVGLSPNGNNRVPNNYGIDIQYGASYNKADKNVVSGNFAQGVEISHDINSQPHHNQVTNNYIGTNTAGTGGTSVHANGGAGVRIKDGAHDTIVENNVIGNNVGGIYFEIRTNYAMTSYNIIRNNRIGVTAAGNPLPNSQFGISADTQHATIGPNNIIANNTGPGILINGDDKDFNSITQNSIYNNTGLGIDLAPIGSSNPNDSGDADSGPNQQLNYPVITPAKTTQIAGTACFSCTVELFITDSPAGQYGEGKTYIGAATTNTSGRFTYTGIFTLGQVVTATARDSYQNTSEFAQNKAIE